MSATLPVDFAPRSLDFELMDDPGVDPAELTEALRQLAFVNRFLGGHATTLDALTRLVPGNLRDFSVLDVGTGGGDTARRIIAWARRRGGTARVHGIDLSPQTIACACRKSADLPGLEFTMQNLFDLSGTRTYDIVHASLVLHHLSDAAAVEALARMYDLCHLGLVVNDLHRHPAAYRSIGALTTLLSRNRLIRYDAPLSVLRAFTRSELENLVRRAGLPAPEIAWHWAFRWQLIVRR